MKKSEKPANKEFALFKIPFHFIWFSKTHPRAFSLFLPVSSTLHRNSFLRLIERAINFFPISLFSFSINSYTPVFSLSDLSTVTSPKKKWRISRILKKCNSGRITGTYGTLISWELSRSILHVSSNHTFSSLFFIIIIIIISFLSLINFQTQFFFADCCLSLWWYVIHNSLFRSHHQIIFCYFILVLLNCRLWILDLGFHIRWLALTIQITLITVCLLNWISIRCLKF